MTRRYPPPPGNYTPTSGSVTYAEMQRAIAAAVVGGGDSGGGGAGDGLTVVTNGADAAIPRPQGAAAVYWVGTVQPANMTGADLWNGRKADGAVASLPNPITALGGSATATFTENFNTGSVNFRVSAPVSVTAVDLTASEVFTVGKKIGITAALGVPPLSVDIRFLTYLGSGLVTDGTTSGDVVRTQFTSPALLSADTDYTLIVATPHAGATARFDTTVQGVVSSIGPGLHGSDDTLDGGDSDFHCWFSLVGSLA
jgi:hypothetical protein